MQVTYTTLHPMAYHALIASANWHRWGRASCIAYARNRAVPLRLVVIARQLHVATANGF